MKKAKSDPREAGNAAPDGSALIEMIAAVERDHFRTEHDSGANRNAMMIWNYVRKHAGLEPLTIADLPAWCETCQRYHIKPHSRKPNNQGQIRPEQEKT
jgi:hypothetical protein